MKNSAPKNNAIPTHVGAEVDVHRPVDQVRNNDVYNILTSILMNCIFYFIGN
jgi:hypothetical protein